MIFPYSSVKSISRYQASVKEIGLTNHRSNTRVGSNPTTQSGTAEMDFNIRDYV